MAHSSQRERITQYIQDTYGTEAEYLVGRQSRQRDIPPLRQQKVVRRHDARSPGEAGIGGRRSLDVMDIKCSTIMIGSLLATKGFLPAYHMNKNHWISIVLDNSVSDDQIIPLLELSYDSVAPKRRKKRARSAEE